MGLVLSLAIFGMFFGIIGALVAAPVTGAAYRVLQYVGREWDNAGEREEEQQPSREEEDDEQASEE